MPSWLTKMQQWLVWSRKKTNNISFFIAAALQKAPCCKAHQRKKLLLCKSKHTGGRIYVFCLGGWTRLSIGGAQGWGGGDLNSYIAPLDYPNKHLQALTCILKIPITHTEFILPSFFRRRSLEFSKFIRRR